MLDLGTGTGTMLPALRAAAPKSRVIGVDRATGMLREAQARVPSALLAAMDLADLGIRESVADAALLAFVLFLVPSPAAALAEIRRVLRPGGTLGCTAWGQGDDLPGTAIWTRELGELLELTSRYGATSRRLSTLDPPSRRECLERVGTALAELPAGELVYRPEMLLAVAAPTASFSA